ncbi:helix-turn-helix transcriptional regulator [Rhodopirellula sp. P2]|uniref:helix-turn-helix transcriptional regulator n=1 Tax=Rhodopirellula sp. P2 TaxID=2127060 RepID=UPI002367B0FA|nr:ArsR family transcriptional regulator [Rhodopirellula sp. P2]WDQ17675.1 ArsR family transcriptional regulator [Rhodopirellula sp. P2]
MATSSSTSESTSDPTGERPISVVTSRAQTAVNAAVVRSVDRELLLCLRSGEPKAIGDLTKQLGVTATAVRQRVERLLEVGLIAREKVVAGRGRPTYHYVLTPAGYRRAGADATELAEAMWAEIVAISEEDTREKLISAIASRLGRQFAAALQGDVDGVAVHDENKPACSCQKNGGDEDTFQERMQRLTSMLQTKEISASLIEVTSQLDGVLPVLDIEACPYPSLTAAAGDRSMCRLEEQMLSEALGEDVHLSSCRMDGDSCCQFSTKSDNDTNSTSNSEPG